MKKIDFHSHILPGADHGSDSVQTSMAQLQIISEAGVNIVVATPHYYPHVHIVSSYILDRDYCFNKLKDAIGENSFGVSLIIGAEVLVCEGLEQMRDLDKLCIKGTNTILLEMPFKPYCDATIQTVKNIADLGLNVVLAHIDRYDYDDVMRLLDMGGLHAQLNTESLKSSANRKRYMSLIKDGTVVALGSDLHGAKKSSYKHFDKVCELLGDNCNVIMKRTESYIENAEKFEM